MARTPRAGPRARVLMLMNNSNVMIIVILIHILVAIILVVVVVVITIISIIIIIIIITTICSHKPASEGSACDEAHSARSRALGGWQSTDAVLLVVPSLLGLLCP